MNEMKTKKQLGRVLTVLACGAVIGAWILLYRSGSAPAAPAAASVAAEAQPPAERVETIVLTAQQLERAGIVVQTAKAARISSVHTLTGAIRFNEDRTAHIVPRLAGVVESVHADLGQRVKKGQLLATVASPLLAEQRSEWLNARQRLALAATTYEREQRLWESKISAEQDYLQARQVLQEAQIAARNVEQKLNAMGVSGAAGRALNRYELRAPFDGVIVEKHVALGESVREDSSVFTLSDLSTVWAEIAVPAASLESVRLGGKVTVRAAASSTQAQGTIADVGTLLGEQTRTAQARVVLPNPHMAWRPGLFVTVDVAAEGTAASVAVPVDAVQTVAGRPTVFVRVADGFEARPVSTGSSDGVLVEVVDGLAEGTPYAASGSFVVKAELGKSNANEAR